MPQDRSPLKLEIRYAVLDNLGISLYQKPVDVISELVANAWDADANFINIFIDVNSQSITASDDGVGMSYDECQGKYLQLGRDRRAELSSDVTEVKKRKVLGRKGIGKFAGFGVARKISINTKSAKTKEDTAFTLDLDKIDASSRIGSEQNIVCDSYCKALEGDGSGTTVSLMGFSYELNARVISEVRKGLGRRFVLDSIIGPEDSFKIMVNHEPIENGFDSSSMEFLFPRDLNQQQRNDLSVNSVDKDGWACSSIEGKDIFWRVGFLENTIEEEDQQGIAIFARGKLAQSPFAFERTGGSSSEYAIAYMTGQMKMDFVDDEELNLISPERQRIDFEKPVMRPVKQWGQKLVNVLGKIRKDKRSEHRRSILFSPDNDLGVRLSRMNKGERRRIEGILNKMSEFPNLGFDRFQDWAGNIITAYEGGRLYSLLDDLSKTQDFDKSKMLEVLKEAGALTDLQVAETIKTKILTIGELQRKMREWNDNENEIRDYISHNPWIIHPKWATFCAEKGLWGAIKASLGKNDLPNDGDVYGGRIDLLLYSGEQYLLLEFMKPGLKLDVDHITRLERYSNGVNRWFSATKNKQLLESWVIAEYAPDADVRDMVEARKRNDPPLYFLTWSELLSDCKRQFGEQIEIYQLRNPEDERIQAL